MTKSANLLAERLNQDVMFYLNGEVNRNDGKINLSELASLIDYFYFKNKTIPNKNAYMTKVQKTIREAFNCLCDTNESYLDKKYTYIELIVFMFLVVHLKSITDIESSMNLILNALTEKEVKYFKYTSFGKSAENKLCKIAKDVGIDV
jgi:hypothetical protein